MEHSGASEWWILCSFLVSDPQWKQSCYASLEPMRLFQHSPSWDTTEHCFSNRSSRKSWSQRNSILYHSTLCQIKIWDRKFNSTSCLKEVVWCRQLMVRKDCIFVLVFFSEQLKCSTKSFVQLTCSNLRGGVLHCTSIIQQNNMNRKQQQGSILFMEEGN